MSLARPKIVNLFEKVRFCVDNGLYLDSRHAQDRRLQRNITRPEILYVLKNGRHEKSKDQYQEQYKAWNYSFRGVTVDRRDLRVIFSFDTNYLLIITAIELG